ncbi:MAG TPA: glycosyltransferase family 2 protein [Thermoanaerobaculia bacterium]|nr:glycosyltransferase family 2 protein [Thermoanaerobaculia bacterium]
MKNRTTAIVAAWNEENTIADVLRALTASPLIDEVIVVSDGSVDRTVEIARTFDGVRTVALRENHGKGFAMAVGVANATHDTLFFCDGDMYNVTEKHIEALVLPVLRGECDMNIGVRHRGDVADFLHLKMKCGPVLSGIRVMKKAVFETVPPQYQSHYKIEAALNCFCARAGYRQEQTIIHGLDHVIKESKRGLLDGLHSRWKMSREVFLLLFDLYVFETWRWTEPAELPVAEYDLFE